MMRLLRRSRRPAAATVAVADADGWPVVYQDCTGICQRPNQPHEDHGDGITVCHNCGHPPPRAA